MRMKCKASVTQGRSFCNAILSLLFDNNITVFFSGYPTIILLKLLLQKERPCVTRSLPYAQGQGYRGLVNHANLPAQSRQALYFLN